MYKNGDIYTGKWKNNLKQGRGELKFKDGSVFTGKFKND
jgi:hypothetical protein